MSEKRNKGRPVMGTGANPTTEPPEEPVAALGLGWHPCVGLCLARRGEKPCC
jgi:hypothetical protein